MSVGRGLQGTLPWAEFLNYRRVGSEERTGDALHPSLAWERLFTLSRMCGNHNNVLSLIAVAQLVINAGWRMYTLPAWAAQVNSTLCVCLKMRQRGKSSSGGSSVLKIPLTDVELTQGTAAEGAQRHWLCRSSSELSTCIFLNSLCRLPLSLVGLYHSGFDYPDFELSSSKLAL